MMTLLRTATLIALSLLMAIDGASRSDAATYVFDSRHTDVNFTYYVGFLAKSGHFTRLDGTVELDEKNPQSGSIKAVIKTASLTAEDQEAELKGSDFFNIAVFPEIHFKSRSVKPVGANRTNFIGDLTMRGVTRPVIFHAVLAGGRHLTAKAQIKRSAFNMTAYSFLVGDEIEIRIEADLIEKPNSDRGSD
jgi:polyisoprenoid-binding protein YceI